MTGPVQFLAAVAARGPGSGAPLAEWLSGVRCRQLGGIPAHADDIRQGVAIKLLTDAPAILESLLQREPTLSEYARRPEDLQALDPRALAPVDRRLTAFVRAMLRNSAIDVVRAEQRYAPATTHSERIDREPWPDDHLELQELSHFVGMLRGALGPNEQATLDEIVALDWGDARMQSLVDDACRQSGEDCTDADVRRRVRLRVSKRHQRVREEVERQRRRMVAHGQLPPEYAGALGSFVILLRRRRIIDRGSVSTKKPHCDA